MVIIERQMHLANKSALVTGGTRGIGRALVLSLVEHGANVAFTYNKDSKAAESLLDLINLKDKSKAVAIQGDVKDFNLAKEIVSQVREAFGQLDILINNAGLVRDKSLMLMSESDWKDVIDTNLTGCFNYSKAAIVNFMKQRSGQILNIGSVSGLIGIAGQCNYAASKMGIIGFTKALAKEVASFGIRVNAIAPGFVDTEIVRSIKTEIQAEALSKIPQNRFASAQEIAHLAIQLLDDRLSYITGQVIIIDGGFSL